MSTLLFLFFGCSGKTTDTASAEMNDNTSDSGAVNNEDTNNEPSMSSTDCPTQSEEDCIALESCQPILAAPLTFDEESNCWTRTTEVFTECMSSDMSCGEAEIYARPTPDASCLVFSNTCIPLEWDICDAVDITECNQ